MNDSNKKILSLIEDYLIENEDCRFTQALFNLGIIGFADRENPEAKSHLLRDPYSDTNESVLGRIILNNIK
jgi:hypothetical protein